MSQVCASDNNLVISFVEIELECN